MIVVIVMVTITIAVPGRPVAAPAAVIIAVSPASGIVAVSGVAVPAGVISA
jgi:hypothetical protein